MLEKYVLANSNHMSSYVVAIIRWPVSLRAVRNFGLDWTARTKYITMQSQALITLRQQLVIVSSSQRW